MVATVFPDRESGLRRVTNRSSTLFVLIYLASFSVVSSSKLRCRNTVQGRFFTADDQGALCTLDKVDSTTGCCSFQELDVCKGCDASSQCCGEFEMCVSCCLQPQNEALRQISIQPRGAGKNLYHWVIVGPVIFFH
ncbi:hypothetical protein CYMTET_29344, partial [Cymbomonas tetramitiformis]